MQPQITIITAFYDPAITIWFELFLVTSRRKAYLVLTD